MISAIRSFTERVKPPRALHCEFPIGRTLGKPGDAAFQRKVLDAAFALLAEPEGPVLVDFPEVITDSTDEPLVCEIPAPGNAEGVSAVDEAKALRPAYDQALKANGMTNVGRAVDADGIAGLIEAYARIAAGTAWNEAGVPNNDMLESSKDLMNYYEEAALGLVDQIPGARAAESWFFRSTVTGQLIKDVKAKLKEANNPVGFYVTPMTQ